jgi:hypothetical protein
LFFVIIINQQQSTTATTQRVLLFPFYHPPNKVHNQKMEEAIYSFSRIKIFLLYISVHWFVNNSYGQLPPVILRFHNEGGGNTWLNSYFINLSDDDPISCGTKNCLFLPNLDPGCKASPIAYVFRVGFYYNSSNNFCSGI